MRKLKAKEIKQRRETHGISLNEAQRYFKIRYLKDAIKELSKVSNYPDAYKEEVQDILTTIVELL